MAIRFRGANDRRRQRAAAVTVPAAQAALDKLGTAVLPNQAAVAHLRIKHPDATLAELGELANPPLTKDTVAARLRRLLITAGLHGDAYAPTGQ